MQQTLRWESLKGLSAAMVDQVHDGVRRVLEEAGLSRATAFAASVVVEELCTNILEHSGAQWMELRLAAQEGRACIQVRDNGKPFDPCQVMRQQATDFELQDVIDRRLGLYMLRRLTGAFQCRRDGGCNLVDFEISSDLEGDARLQSASPA